MEQTTHAPTSARSDVDLSCGDGAAGPDAAGGDAHGASTRSPYARAAPLQLTWAVRLAGAIAVMLGGGYFVAWMVGAASRWSVAGVITMKTNMALALVLAGTALVLSERETTPATWVRTAAAALVLATGLLTLAEHLFGVDLGIDQLLATEAPGAAATTSPNRFGVPGSVSLVLVGAGLLSLRARRHVAPYLGLATLLIAAVPTVGFLYRAGLFYSEARVTAIAWPTVVAFSSLAVGLMASKPREGGAPLLWRDDAGGALLRRLWLPAVLVPVLVGALRAEGERRGLYDGSVGDGAATLALIVFFSALLWRSAARLSTAASRQLQAEHALRDALGQARSLGRFPEENPDPVLRLSSDLTVLYANEAALTGLRDTGVAVGRPAPAEIAAAAASAIRAGHRTRSELACGATVFSMTVVPVGSEVNLYGQDITARKQAEEALREADQRKNEFLAVLSHELRNPLAPIRNSTHILRRVEPGSEQARRAQSVIERQTEHLTRLVDDLLDVTRIARGKIALHRERVDLREVMLRAVEDFRLPLEERGVALRVEAPDARLWADADATRVTQVVGNLLHNARKFTRRGDEVVVAISAAGSAAEIKVRDDGAGIDAALLPRVFDPFVQSDRTLARSEGGLGLGLALVKAIAELHGGSVAAESAGAGRGAEFAVRIPLAEPAVLAPAAPGRPHVAGAGTR